MSVVLEEEDDTLKPKDEAFEAVEPISPPTSSTHSHSASPPLLQAAGTSTEKNSVAEGSRVREPQQQQQAERQRQSRSPPRHHETGSSTGQQGQKRGIEGETKRAKAVPTPSSPTSLVPAILGVNVADPVMQMLAGQTALVEPENSVPRGRVHLSQFPDEIMLLIFRFLGGRGISGLSSASRVCRRWYHFSQDPEVWRHLCVLAWASDTRSLGPLFGSSWKRMYTERPRIRLDGLYINRISYMRQGLTEGSYYQPMHVIVYYRYLRFFGDSTVLSFVRILPSPSTQHVPPINCFVLLVCLFISPCSAPMTPPKP